MRDVSDVTGACSTAVGVMISIYLSRYLLHNLSYIFFSDLEPRDTVDGKTQQPLEWLENKR